MKFLAETPPNSPRRIDGLAKYGGNPPRWRIQAPELELHCSKDDGTRIFGTQAGAVTLWEPDRHFEHLHYACRNCGGGQHVFSVVIARDHDSQRGDVVVMKLGQFPPFGAPIPTRIKKLLGDDAELYDKGKRAEAQGLGIGAAAYFRRVVENQWRQLVHELKEAASRLGATDLSAYDAALNGNQFKKAVSLLKDALPQRLLVQGQNPLTLLHDALSAELHNLDDEKCVELAADIRMVLGATLENIAEALADHRELAQAVNRLSQSRSATGDA
jgi:hypothetical protein